MILYLFSGLEPVLGPEVYWLKERFALLIERLLSSSSHREKAMTS